MGGSAQAGQLRVLLPACHSHLAGRHCCAAAATAVGTARLLQVTGSLQGAIVMASVFILCSKWINHSKWASPLSWNLLGYFCPATNVYPAHGGSARHIPCQAHPSQKLLPPEHKPGSRMARETQMLNQKGFGQLLRGVPPSWEPEVVCSVPG